MDKQSEEALKAAFQNASEAQEKATAAIKARDSEGMRHWCSEYNRYCELFSRSLGISEDKFSELVSDFRENQSKSE